MKKRTVVFIVCDAIRWDYLNNLDSPFLIKLCKKGIYCKKIQPSLGFCERAEMLSGTRPDVNGYLTALTFDKIKSDFNNISSVGLNVLKYLLKLMNFIGSKNFNLHKLYSIFIINRLFLRKILRISQPIYEIPFEFLPEIALTEDYCNMWNENALSVETIFDVLRESSKDFLYDTFASLRLYACGSDDLRINNLFSFAEKKEYDLHLIYLGEGDSIGHKYGPSSSQRNEMVKRIDSRIHRIVSFFEKKYSEVDFLIVGDHGMVDVKDTINAWKKIRIFAEKNGLIQNIDYKFFIDSTMVRLWFSNNKSKKVFEKLFETDSEFTTRGNHLKNMELIFHLPLDLKYYGDLIWLAKPGILISPDFFHKHEKVQGMHGYDPKIDDQKGFSILYSKGISYGISKPQGSLIDICPTLCDLLKIRYPTSNQGKSFLKYRQ